MGQDHRNRPRHDQLVLRGHGGRRADRPREQPRAAARPPRSSRSPRATSASSAPSRSARPCQPRADDLLDQALHGPQGGRGQGGGDDGPLLRVRRPQRRRPDQHRRQAVLAARDLGDDPAEDQGRRRGEARRDRRLGGDHRPRLLQRRSAPGDQGRRQDRRPRRQADHQRADRRVAGLRPRQGGRRSDDPRLRPRRRHVRRVGARDRRRRLRGEVDRRRQPPRRRQLGQGDRRLARRGVQEATRASTSRPTRTRCSGSTRAPRRRRSSSPPRRRPRSTSRSSRPSKGSRSTST